MVNSLNRAATSGPARLLSYSLAVYFLFTVLLAGCTRLPDYASPAVNQNKTEVTEHLFYRQLHPSDFKADSPGNDFPDLERHLNARSSLSIRPGPSTRFLLHQSDYDGIPLYFGDIENLTFQAVFLPEKSWWSPNVSSNKVKYVLQHEQIHFALMELLARRLTKEKSTYREGLPIIEYSEKDTKRELIRWIQDIIDSYQNDFIEEHTAFDEDTSLFYSPESQSKWWNDVQNRLKETE